MHPGRLPARKVSAEATDQTAGSQRRSRHLLLCSRFTPRSRTMTSRRIGSRPGKSPPAAAARRRRGRPAVEALEDRLAPAAAFGLTTTNGIYTFDTATPGDVSAVINVTGLAVNEELQGIDFRPADGKLYALGRVPGT